MAPNKSMILCFAWGVEQQGRLHQCERSRNRVTQNKHGGDTYWDYSLSWYNLVRERVRWWDQKRRRERERKNSTKEENIKHPSKYILQTFQYFSEPTIRGQTWESKLPLFLWAETSACVWAAGSTPAQTQAGITGRIIDHRCSYTGNKTGLISSPEPCWVILYIDGRMWIRCRKTTTPMRHKSEKKKDFKMK